MGDKVLEHSASDSEEGGCRPQGGACTVPRPPLHGTCPTPPPRMCWLARTPWRVDTSLQDLWLHPYVALRVRTVFLSLGTPVTVAQPAPPRGSSTNYFCSDSISTSGPVLRSPGLGL